MQEFTLEAKWERAEVDNQSILNIGRTKIVDKLIFMSSGNLFTRFYFQNNTIVHDYIGTICSGYLTSIIYSEVFFFLAGDALSL